MGESTFNQESKKYELRKGPLFTNILLADELNRAPPITQSALLEVMAEKQVTLGGVSYEVPRPFTVIATMNPIEQAGTYVLPEAQKDRFLFKVFVSYPTKEDEISIIKSKLHAVEIGKIFTPPEILIIREEIKNRVNVSETLLEYSVKLVESTRDRREVATGASPRASIAFMRAAKTRAFLHGRDHVTVEDLQVLAYPILRHRVLLNPTVEEYGTTPDEIIGKVLDHVEAP